MTNQPPIEVLEVHATAERQQLHQHLSDLRARLQEARHQLEPKKVAREYLLPAAGVTALVAAALGYSIAALFTRK